jgi:hypothetical protein
MGNLVGYSKHFVDSHRVKPQDFNVFDGARRSYREMFGGTVFEVD